MKATLKVLFTALALGVMASTPALRAQDDKAPSTEAPKGGKGGKGGRGMPSVDEEIARIDKAVTLTADQKAKIKDIISKTREQMQGLAPEDRRTKGRELMQAQRDQIRAVLTDEQKTKFDEMPQPQRGGKGGKKKDN